MNETEYSPPAASLRVFAEILFELGYGSCANECLDVSDYIWSLEAEIKYLKREIELTSEEGNE